MTERPMSAAMRAALIASTNDPCILCEGEFDGGALRVWTGPDDREWNGETWLAGKMVSISQIEENRDVVSSGVTITIDGVDPAHVALALVDAKQGLPGRIYLGMRDANGDIVADPLTTFVGRLDVPEVNDNANDVSISITYEDRLIDLQRGYVLRYTDEDQQRLYPGDRFFEYQPSIQDVELTWNR